MGALPQSENLQAIQGRMGEFLPDIFVSMCATHSFPVCIASGFQKVVGIGAKGS